VNDRQSEALNVSEFIRESPFMYVYDPVEIGHLLITSRRACTYSALSKPEVNGSDGSIVT
jgi:hypothetical protein